MADTWLYVNDEILDMGNDPIPITRAVQSLAEIDTKLGSFTRSFTVPATDKNRRILQNAYTFNADTKLPYRTIEGRLIANGIELGLGNLIVENNGIGPDTIRLTFYMDASPFYQMASTMGLWDCPLGVFDHYYQYQNIINGRADTSVSGLPVLYPIIDYGDDPTFLTSTANTSAVRADRLYPAIYLKDLLAAVSKGTGYQFTGKILDIPYSIDGILSNRIFDRLIWPYSGGAWKRDTNLKSRYTYSVNNATTRLVDFNAVNLLAPTFNGAGMPVGKRDDDGILPIYPNGTGLLSGKHYTADTVTLRVKVNGTATAGAAFTPYVLINTGPGYLSPFEYTGAKFTDGAGTVFNALPLPMPTPPNPNRAYTWNPLGAGTYTFEITALVTIDAHWQWDLMIRTNAGFFNMSNVTASIEFVADAGTNDDDRQIRFGYPDLVRAWNNTTQYKTDARFYDIVSYGGNEYIALQDNTNVTPGTNPSVWGVIAMNPHTYRVAASLIPGYAMIPNWSVAKFIKGLAQLFGCQILVNEQLKQVELFQLRDLYQNAADAVDWSDKLVDADKIQWNTRPSYGQSSYLKFTNEDGVGADIGKYTITIDDTTLAATKDIITVPWGGTIYENRFTNIVTNPPSPQLYQVAIIKRLDNDGKFSGPDGARLLYIGWWQGDLGQLTYKKMDGSTLGTVTTNQPYTFFANSSNVPQTLGFDKSYRYHYRWLNYITDNYRMVTVYVNLTGGDLRQIDFRYPVFISQLNNKFYIQRIKDWLPGKPVAVELIKM